MLRTLVLGSLVLTFVVSGCSGEDTPGGPADAAPDAGVVPGDTGVRPDTGFHPNDAGEEPDTGAPDTGYDAGDQPDVGPPDTGYDGGQPDAVAPNVDVVVSGQLRRLGEYLAGTTAGVGQASVLAYGVDPQATALTDPQGNYELRLPQNGQIVLYSSKQGYFPTINTVTTQAADLPGRNLYIVENAWLNAIAQAHNVDLNAPFACHAPALNPNQQCIYTAIVGRVLDDGTAGNGTLRPVGGITRENFTIRGGNGPQADQWYKRGPYFLDYTGTASAAATETIVYNDNGNYRGGYFVTFLEIPQTDGNASIDVELSINYPYNGVNRYFGPVAVKAFRPYAVTWTTIQETGAPPPPPPPNGVNFDTQVYPLFLPVAQGGYGCQGCHTNQNGATPAAGMNLYGGPEVAFNSLDPQRYPARVNLANPSASYVLVRPLYEANGPQDHPIFAFLSDQDPAYRLIYTWIQEGAQRQIVQQPVSFENEIRPLLYRATNQGGIGCYNCHVNGVNANNAPGGFYMGGNADDLYAELTAEAPQDTTTGQTYRIDKDAGQADQSLVLIKPLFGNPIGHPVKIFSSNADPRYQLIYRWISEGYAR